MQKVVFIISLLLFTAYSSTDLEMSSLWKVWKAYHSKAYASEGEDTARFAIFSDNYKKIQNFNAANETPKLAINHFADLTAEEFKNTYSRCAFSHKDAGFKKADTLEYEMIDLPNDIDWRTKGKVTDVKNQGQCGSCWAFSATGAIESWHAIQTNKLVSFSEQQLVDCDTNDLGCNGGYEQEAMQFAAQKGLETEADYPYKAVDGQCKYDKSKAIKANSGYSDVTASSVDALKTALTKQPVTVAIEADESVFQFYSSGVIKSNCGDYLDHAVLVVGYTTVSGTEAWIVKNSWGTSWGVKGYVYISTDPSPNGGTGVCGILSEPAVPN